MLSLLGIRHHGPGSARSVMAALDELQPAAVLVEAAAESTTAFEWVGRGLVPPVALLGYVVDDPGRAVFSPFAEFSPEWQAIVWANDRGVPVEAIDLPLTNSLAGERDDASILFADGRPADPIAELAAAAGETDAERWWDDVIEHRGDGLTAFAAVAEAMTAVRAGSITNAREEQREAFMRKRIRAAIKQHGDTAIAVVCGAWHVPALDVTADYAPSASADAATLRGLPKVKVAVSWVPWTEPRLATRSGYGAGVRSPGWYGHVFRHPGDESVPRFFVDAARVLRAHDIGASPDHLIAATRLADALAVMRGRPRAGLDEVLDAADSVMGGLPIVRERLVVGTAIGSVPDGAPQVPLARDLAKQQKSARLKMTADEQVIEVDLRTPAGLRKSHLLHRLTALGVPWGHAESGRGSTGTFRETWSLVWAPELAVTVVERAGYGTTVERAATARLIEHATETTGVIELARSLDLALLADLPAAIDPVVTSLATRAATDPDIAALMGALGPLAQAQRYGDVRATDAAAIAKVFDGLVVRVLAGLVVACRSLDADAAAAMVERISETQQALNLVDHPARRRAYPDVLAQLAESTGNGLVQGRATRVLHDSGKWSMTEVQHRLGRALSPGTRPAAGAAFVEGFLAGSGTVLVHDAALRAVIDRWVASLPTAAFDETVPLLRRTFGAFEPAERRQLGRLIIGEQRERVAAFGAGLDEARTRAVIATVRSMLGVAALEPVSSGPISVPT